MRVLDASAVLAWLQDEPGSDAVERTLQEGAVIGAANWSEIAQKVHAAGSEWALTSALLRGYGVQVEQVTQEDAEAAALRWSSSRALSLGDRLCLSLAARLEVPVLTADRAWGNDEGVIQLRP